jgi:hypothetical protein
MTDPNATTGKPEPHTSNSSFPSASDALAAEAARRPSVAIDGMSGSPVSPAISPPVASAPPDDASLENLESLTRLLIGGTLVASDELVVRLRRWHELTRTATLETRPETPTDRLRYAVVGMIFEAEERAYARLARMGQASAQTTQRVVNALVPLGRRLPTGPMRGPTDKVAAQWRATLDRWAARGRIEERQGRIVARQAAASVMDEVLQHMAHDPEVQELIRQQGVGLATTAMETVRERSQSADVWVERMVHGFFRRPVRERAEDARRTPATTVPLAPTDEPTQSV